jgi:hypothetical protein
MGRHGGGPTSERVRRVSMPLIAIGVLILAAIGFAIWLWSIRSVTDPIDAHPVDAYAVVVSSPSCTSGSGATVIDLDVPPVVRSSLSACGRRVGERLAVEYLSGQPEQVRLAGTTVANNTALGRWLPVAIVGAGLLAVIGTIALMIDRRASKHGGIASRVTVAQLRARDTELDETPGAPLTPLDEADSTDGPDSADAPGIDGAGENPDVTSRIAMTRFPEDNPTFRPSEIAVEEDLFTHRGLESPDR